MKRTGNALLAGACMMSVIPPIMLWMAMRAQQPDADPMMPTGTILSAAGMHLIPQGTLITGCLATAALWALGQAESLLTDARKGRPLKATKQPGFHLVAILMWSASGALTMEAVGFAPALQNITEWISVAAVVGVLLRVATLRLDEEGCSVWDIVKDQVNENLPRRRNRQPPERL